MMTREQYAKACKARAEIPGLGRRRLCKIAGCTDYAADQFLQGKYDPVPAAAGRVQAAVSAAVRLVPVDDFASRFDFGARLRKALGELCRNGFVSEADIRAYSGIPVGEFRSVAAGPEFQSCQIRNGGITWWSVKENVDTVRAKAQKWSIRK